jgi:hypothetical protein
MSAIASKVETGAVVLASRWLCLSLRRLNPVWLGSVSCSRSSNRTGGVTASGSRKRRTVLRVTPSATSEHNLGWRDLWVNPHVLCCFLRPSLTEAPSLRRSYPASSVLRTSRHPTPPGLSLASCQLIPTAITVGASRVACGLLCLHALAITPAGSMKLVRSSVSIDCGLPCDKARSALAIVFSRPARRSLALRPARSPSRQRPSTPKAPTAWLPLLPLRLLPDGANQFPGGSYTR